jgi:hypothetical protein
MKMWATVLWCGIAAQEMHAEDGDDGLRKRRMERPCFGFKVEAARQFLDEQIPHQVMRLQRDAILSRDLPAVAAKKLLADIDMNQIGASLPERPMWFSGRNHRNCIANEFLVLPDSSSRTPFGVNMRRFQTYRDLQAIVHMLAPCAPRLLCTVKAEAFSLKPEVIWR